MLAAGRTRPLDDLHLGAVDVDLHAAHTALRHAAARIDAGEVADPALLALRTRSVVATSVERVLQQVAHALGPAPLTFDASHARQVADLEVYVRQHHGERDLAALGSALLGARDGVLPPGLGQCARGVAPGRPAGAGLAGRR